MRPAALRRNRAFQSLASTYEVRSIPEALDQQFERRRREAQHIRLPVRAAGLERDRALDGSHDREAAMAGRIAVAIAARARCARFRKPPARRKSLDDGPRQEKRV